MSMPIDQPFLAVYQVMTLRVSRLTSPTHDRAVDSWTPSLKGGLGIKTHQTKSTSNVGTAMCLFFSARISKNRSYLVGSRSIVN